MATRAKKPAPEPVPVASEEEDGRPQWWDWGEDGDVVAGTFLEAGAGHTQHGKKPFLVVDVEGTPRTVWCHFDALLSQVREQIEEYGPFKQGERVEIRRTPKQKESANGRSYYPFRLSRPDLPPPDQAALFGVGEKPAEEQGDEPEKAEEPTGRPNNNNDDDIPF
jgi:hypothetical protein